MNRFSLQLSQFDKKLSSQKSTPHESGSHNYFDKDMNYFICSYGGSGSTVLFNYLSNFGNVYHIHDRYPPNKLSYVGNTNSEEEVYSEWFNNVTIPANTLTKYKVIFIYRHPIPVIFSRFAQAAGPNIPHLQHIKCQNNGNVRFSDVLQSGRDLYGIEEFFDNYITTAKRNYDVYAVKYELFWNNIGTFNSVIGIPNIKSLYPVRQEKPKKLQFVRELTMIYSSLINKMNSMRFIEILPKYDENKTISEEVII